MKILITGLPGSGKTTLAEALHTILNSKYWNADKVRAMHQDWDFTHSGRLRQAYRLHDLCDNNSKYNIVDFICPTHETRAAFQPDFVVFMNTIQTSEPTTLAADGSSYNDTDQIYQKPIDPDVIVTEKDVDKWVDIVYNTVIETLPRW